MCLDLHAGERRRRRTRHAAAVDRLGLRRRHRIFGVGKNDEYVAGVRVGVEMPINRDLLQVRSRQLFGDRMEVMLDARQR